MSIEANARHLRWLTGVYCSSAGLRPLSLRTGSRGIHKGESIAADAGAASRVGAVFLLNGAALVGLHLLGVDPRVERILTAVEALLVPLIALLVYKTTESCCKCGQSTLNSEGRGLRRREFLSLGFRLFVVAALTQLGLGRVAKVAAAPRAAKVKKLEVLDSRRLGRGQAANLAVRAVKKEFVRSLIDGAGLGAELSKVPLEGLRLGST